MKFKKVIKKVATKKAAKAVAKYGGAGLTGYEVGEVIESVAEILSSPKEQNYSNKTIDGKIELTPSVELSQSLFDIKILLLVILGVVIVVSVVGIGYKTYLAIGKKATKKFKKSLETKCVYCLVFALQCFKKNLILMD